MSLYQDLQKAKTEEDIKQKYINAFGLKEKEYTMGRTDIETDNIWFEAKKDPTSVFEMFTQLLHYVYWNYDKGSTIPPFLGVFDREKAALLETKNIIPLLENKKIKWKKNKASHVDKILVEEISHHIGTYIVQYNIEHFEKEFIEAVKIAIREKRFVRTLITPNNLKEVFDIWVEKIGREIIKVEEKDFTLLFYADIMSDGSNPTLEAQELPAYIMHAKGKTGFILHNKSYHLAQEEGYKEFWNIYERPPKPEYRKDLLERQDSLIALDHRKFTGAYYTPLVMVRRAYETLNHTLGENWQKEYIVWDMCAGVGNLEVLHNYPRQVFISTLDQEHIHIMQSTKVATGASIFQYDYLNDDITKDGEIDYTLTNKVPVELQKILTEGTKKVLVLINPPYGEAGAGIGKGKDNKTEVSTTQMSKAMDGFGKAKNELFTQFIARILKEIPNCTLAMFSTLKYVNAPNFVDFRTHFKAQFLGGFITHSKAFDGLKGDFPIGFCIWRIDHKTPLTQINLTIVDKHNTPIGDKTFSAYQTKQFLNKWVVRPKANKEQVVPLKNAISVGNQKNILDKWADDALGYMCLGKNDMQHAPQETFLLSSTYGDGHGMYITPANLQKAAIMFTVRRIIKHTWVKDRDQFLIPHTQPSTEFAHDCLLWMLFNGSNLTASADGLEYQGKSWSIINHFIPYTEAQVGANGRFESDFMVEYLKQQGLPEALSPEALAVYNKGLELWQAYFRSNFNYKIREELKLERPDIGWYQLRKALEHKKDNPPDFEGFKQAYQHLTDKLSPQVYTYGFLQ